MTDFRARHFDDVTVGDVISPITFHVSLPALVKYAAATWDFHPYHYDAEFMKGLGLAAPIADGQMFGALVARMLMSWGGPDAFVKRLNYRLLSPVFASETVHLSGRVVSKSLQEMRPLIGTQVSVAKEDGTIVVRDAAAIVELGPLVPETA